MGHGKLAKFADMETFPNVVQDTASPFLTAEETGDACATPSGARTLKPSPMQGHWDDFFTKLKGAEAAEAAPLVLELGCGRGEYTLGLAREYAQKNFIGVDIKGARMWHGAREALASGLHNAAFLRTQIEFLERFFAPGEVSELWLTFSDPQMKKPTKRLTSSYFLSRYRRFLCDGGVVHLKTDSNFLFTYTRELLRANGITPDFETVDLYAPAATSEPSADLLPLRTIQTYYEQMWLARGITIKYLRFRLPHNVALREPDVEIPMDEYRSYNRHKRSSKETSK